MAIMNTLVSFLVVPVIIGKCLISVTEFLLAYLLGKSNIEDINSQSLIIINWSVYSHHYLLSVPLPTISLPPSPSFPVCPGCVWH